MTSRRAPPIFDQAGSKQVRKALSTIHAYPDELDYVNAKLHPRVLEASEQERLTQAWQHAFGRENRPLPNVVRIDPDCGSFVETFCRACLMADWQNYALLQPVLRQLMQKYPADPRRLAMERHDRGGDLPGDEQLLLSELPW